MTTSEAEYELNTTNKIELESLTCSVRCTICTNRVWFKGDLCDQNPVFECPYCGKIQESEFIKTSIRG